MIIAILFIFPILSSAFLFFFKNKQLNVVLTAIYSLIYLSIVMFLVFKPQQFTEFLKVDSLNVIFLLILAILQFGISIYNIDFLTHSQVSIRDHTLYSIFYQFFVMAMTGIILSTHFGLLWVFIEATTLITLYLINFNKTKESLEASWKYIFICSIGISLAFVGIIFLSIGNFNINSLFFEDIYKNYKNINPFWLKLSFLFILIGFGTKMGLAPVHSWLPDAHSEAPSPISAMLSGALLNGSFLGILRIFKVMRLCNLDVFAKILLLIMGFLSLLVAASFIVKITNYKRMLAYSSIENMGIIAIGIGLGGVGLYASFLHLISHSLTKASFFLTAGNVLHTFHTKETNKITGILKTDRYTGFFRKFSFFAIIGLPPFPIFISEFLILKEMIFTKNIILFIIFVILLTIIIFGLGKSVLKMVFGEKNEHIEKYKNSFWVYLPQTLFLIILVIIGLYIPNFLHKMIENAVNSL